MPASAASCSLSTNTVRFLPPPRFMACVCFFSIFSCRADNNGSHAASAFLKAGPAASPMRALVALFSAVLLAGLVVVLSGDAAAPTSLGRHVQLARGRTKVAVALGLAFVLEKLL